MVLFFLLLIVGKSQYLTLKNKFNKVYYAQFGVGSPNQEFTVPISAYSSVNFTYLPMLGSGICKGNNGFNYTKSTTYSELVQNFEVTYLEGFIIGNLSKDQFSLDFTDKYIVKNQIFNLAYKSSLPQVFQCGLLSLGLDTKAYNASIVYNLYLNGRISRPTFSLFLNDIGFNGDKKYEAKSNIIFGGYDLNKFALDPNSYFKYHQISNILNVWSIVASSFTYGSIYMNGLNEALILEPGFSFIAVPSNILIMVFAKVKSKMICDKNLTFLICPCESSLKLPDLVFVVDNATYTIPAKYYIQEEQDKRCVLLLVSSNQSNWVLGQIFLRQYYSYYHFHNKSVGLIESIYYKSKHHHSDDKKISDEWLITIICVTTFIVVGASLILCWIYSRHKRPHRDSILSSDSQFSLE